MMQTKQPKLNILVIEDDPALSLVLQKELNFWGYNTDAAMDGALGLFKAKSGGYALVITDVALPRLSGLTVLKEIKQANKNIPFIVITSFNQSDNEIKAYYDGANIFHKKPIDYKVLRAQVKMLTESAKRSPIIKIKDLSLDPKKQLFMQNAKPISLSKKEFEFIKLLMTSPGEVFSRAEIINALAMRHYDADEGSVDTLISRVRSKLKKYKDQDVIETVFGKGYRLNTLYLE